MSEPYKFYNLSVSCFNCNDPIGTISIREDLLALPKPEPGQPMTDRMVTAAINSLFVGMANVTPSSLGLCCPVCLAELTAKARAKAMN